MSTLGRKIAAASEKTGSFARAKTLVSLDASNIAGWDRRGFGQYHQVRFPGDSDVPPPSLNDVYLVRHQVVSMAKLAQNLAVNDDVSSIKYYTPEAKLNNLVVDALYSWLTVNGHASTTLTGKTPGSRAFVKEMVRIYRNLVGSNDIEEFFGKHAPMVRALFRSHQNKVMASPFQSVQKAEIVIRSVEDTSRSILENPDHRFQAKAILSFLRGANDLNINAQRLDFNIQTHDFVNLRKAAEEAAATFERMRQSYPEVDWDDLPSTMQKIRSKAGQIVEFADTYNERSRKLTDIMRDQSELIDGAAESITGPSGYMKGDLDTALVAKSMSPEVLAKYDQQVIFSGDGDFVPLYKSLMDAGKRVIVVSPDKNVSRAIRSMVGGQLELHDPLIDDIWMDR